MESSKRYDEYNKQYYFGKLILRKTLNINIIPFDRFVGMYGTHEHIYLNMKDKIIKDSIALEAYHRRVNPHIKQKRNIVSIIKNLRQFQ